MKKYLGSAAISALLAAPAFAGNLQEPVVEPIIAAPVQVQPISDWTGFYVGGQLGYGEASGADEDVSGGLGGLHAGYLYDLGQWVIGGELDYDWADMSDTFGGVEVKVDEIARLKLIGGYDLGNGLLYATAGAFNANLNASVGSLETNVDDNGWLAGIGYKHKFTENWVGGVEALYHKASDFDDSGEDLKIKTLTARISYKF
jgi:outer membrane immunogenic protein|tara:strand:- start:1359 stop:1964 length:606 start_codon:yes stop_codon:yes gene_type:complete|mmetsp:Transcript_10334/g.13213  ORF Transcript_10334/g.13213 Transcript_10334/m.13213 type:complete len:202 (-) Transcript_10334:399-1004(-)